MRKCRCGQNGVNVSIKKSFPLTLQLGASPELFQNYDNILFADAKKIFPTIVTFFILHTRNFKSLSLSLSLYFITRDRNYLPIICDVKHIE